MMNQRIITDNVELRRQVQALSTEVSLYKRQLQATWKDGILTGVIGTLVSLVFVGMIGLFLLNLGAS